MNDKDLINLIEGSLIPEHIKKFWISVIGDLSDQEKLDLIAVFEDEVQKKDKLSKKMQERLNKINGEYLSKLKDFKDKSLREVRIKIEKKERKEEEKEVDNLLDEI